MDASLLRQEELKQENLTEQWHNFTMYRWYAPTTTPNCSENKLSLLIPVVFTLRNIFFLFFCFVFSKNIMNMMPLQYNIGITYEETYSLL